MRRCHDPCIPLQLCKARRIRTGNDRNLMPRVSREMKGEALPIRPPPRMAMRSGEDLSEDSDVRKQQDSIVADYLR